MAPAGPLAPAIASEAGPTTPVLDSFNRPNEDPLSQGGAWAPDDPRVYGFYNTLEVISYAAATDNAAQNISYRPQMYSGDLELYGTVAAKPGTGQTLTLVFGIRELGGFSWDGYYFRFGDEAGTDSLRLLRIMDNSSSVLLGEAFAEVEVGDKLMARKIGSQLEGWLFRAGVWSLVVTGQDNVLVGGMIGAGISNTSGRWENFGGGAYPGPGSGPEPLTVTPTTLAGATLGQPYAQAVTASGGTTPYSWTLSAGTLPPGLSLSATGTPSAAISGTPTTAGTYTFTVRVTDGAAAIDTQDFSITVLAPPTITTASLPGGTVGQAYSQPVIASGGTAPYVWTVTAGTLPPGLSLTRSGTPSAMMSGTPSLAGTFTFTVRVADSAAPFAADTQDLSITVAPSAAPPINPSTLDDFNRPPENPVSQGGNWSSVGINGGPGAPLDQNTLRNFPGPSGGFSYRVTPYSGGDMEAAATVITRPKSNDWISVFVCLQDAGTLGWDGYELRGKVVGGPDLWEIRRVINGVSGVIGSINFEMTVGGKMLLRRIDDTLQFWWKPSGGAWAQKLPVTDPNFRWGMIGVGGYRTGVLDDFGGGSLLSLIDQYAPELRPHALDTFRAASPAMMTDNHQPTYSNTLMVPSGGILAQADPELPEDNLSLYYLDLFYPPGGFAQGRASTVDDYLDAAGNYDLDAQRLQAFAIYWDKAYARVVPEPDGSKTLQYWFFYYFNWHPAPTNLGDHEGDWEMIQIELDTRAVPGRVTYAQHGGGEQCNWSLVTRTADGRPAVYVAQGTHASYFRPGDKDPSETAPAGDVVLWSAPAVTPSVEEIDPIVPGWLDWGGRWGESTTGNFQSPYGPAKQGQKWLNPRAWADAQTPCWEGASMSRRGGRLTVNPAADAQVAVDARPPAPKVVATRVGKRVRVSYSFSVWPAGPRRPATLITSIQPSERRFAPLVHRYRLTARKGTFMRPLGLGSAPYKLFAAAYSKKGRSSPLVVARVRTG